MPQQHLIEHLMRRGIPATEEREGGLWRHSHYYYVALMHGMSEAVRAARKDGIDVRDTQEQPPC